MNMIRRSVGFPKTNLVVYNYIIISNIRINLLYKTLENNVFRQLVVCVYVCHFVLVFSILLVLRLPRLGKRELI